MLGFLLLVGLLVMNLFACGISFFIGQTGLVPLLAGVFFVLYGIAAFMAGRGIEFRSPFVGRGEGRAPARRAQRRPASPATSSEFGSLE